MKANWSDFPPPFSVAERVRLLASALQPAAGVFVEAGAHDGIYNSNTLLLEKQGWRGLLVEPSPVAFAQLKENRPESVLANCALTSRESVGHLIGTFTDGHPMASAVSEVQTRHPGSGRFRGENRIRRVLGLPPHIQRTSVPATTLSSLLDDAGFDAVDLLVLDVEGMELECLMGLGHWRPTMIVVETRDRLALTLSDMLLSYGYALAANLSEFSLVNNPQWTQDMQDYAWVVRTRLKDIDQVLQS